MTSKVLCVFVFCMLATGVALAQDDMTVIGDERTKDPEKNAMWREGQTAYSAKPRNMWELGLYGGASLISGDVDGQLGFNAGISIRKALGYIVSLRLSGNYSQSRGYDATPQSFANFRREPIFFANGGVDGPLGVYQGSSVHRNYQTAVFAGQLEVIASLGNILFHSADPKWNAYVGAGIGYHGRTVEADLLDGDSGAYNFESVTAGLDLTDRDDRSTARDNLRDLLDGDFETEGGDDPRSDESVFHGIVSAGISRKVSDRFNIGLEYQLVFAGDDLLDGFNAGSTAPDLLSYLNLRLNFNLGNKERRTQPLYWVNPLDAPMNDIAALKQRPKFDLTDSDGDGVIDMIDQEPETAAGCPVDTRGITLDSDGDGIPDCKDEEPYSPPGYTVNDKGVADVPPAGLTEAEVRQIVNERPLPKTEWFLPMIHFDLDKYYIKPEYYGTLASVSQVMKSHPNLRVVVTGYSDNRGKPDYNAVLSYNRAEAVVNALVERFGVSRDRLVLQYGDEQLIEGLPSNYGTSYVEERGQYMNRRVEFSIAEDNASDASRPEGEAGSNTPGSAREGAKYSGNRSSGY